MHSLDTAWQSLERQFELACSDATRTARQRLIADLNQIFRRLRHYENEEQWMGALRDGVCQHAARFGIFTLKDGVLRLRAQQNLDVREDLEFATAGASAFVAAIESRDPLVALQTAGEVGPALQSKDAGQRAQLFPLTNGTRVVAVLFAVEDKDSDMGALELIAEMAATVLERQSNQALHSQIGPASPKLTKQDEDGTVASEKVRERASFPAWAELDARQRSLHGKARRFSRVAVAEMQLARPEAARAGREQSNIYMFLQNEIDKARESYRKQFMTAPSMVDYLHLELVETAAAGDESKLGADYPGHLV
ncbi:MAG TPA: hypothetical protein VHZ55_31845 [Bryobacteraceae bacterium]|nr:hypothetical protein [Bryobacteraceae bacterium]